MHMTIFRFVLVFLLFSIASEAKAVDCNQPAAPGVDWARCLFDRRDLSTQNLTRAHLTDVSFERANLDRTILVEVDGYRTKFISARLTKAQLDNGLFSEADFTKADLTGASLRNADLRRAHFYHAILRGADLTGAKTLGADMLNADLSNATWTDGKRICAEGSLGQCN